MTCGTAERYRIAKWKVALAVSEAETRVQDEFGKAMEQDFGRPRKVLANRQATRGLTHWFYPCLQQGRRTVDLNWVYSQEVERILQQFPESH